MAKTRSQSGVPSSRVASRLTSADSRSAINASPRPVLRVQASPAPRSRAAALLGWLPEVVAISVLVAIVAVVVSALV